MTRRTDTASVCNRLRVAPALLFAALGFGLSACGRQSSTATASRTEAVSEADRALPSQAPLSQRFIAVDSGTYSSGSVVSTWRAGTANGGLRYISERLTEAYAVQRDRLFEFDSTGVLAHYVEHTNSTLRRDMDRGAAHIGTIELEFAGGEAVFRARRTGGTPRSIRQWEVDRVLERAELLRRVSSRAQVTSATATAPPGAPESHR